MTKSNYYLDRNSKTGELLYLEFDKIEGYNINPKANIEDAIRVNKIVFVNPTLSEKLIRKKIEIKIRYLLKKLEEFNDSSADEGAIENAIMDCEKLRIMIINNYIKYLGNTYQSLTMKKLQVITNELRTKLYKKKQFKQQLSFDNLFYLDEDKYMETEKRGRGR